MNNLIQRTVHVSKALIELAFSSMFDPCAIHASISRTFGRSTNRSNARSLDRSIDRSLIQLVARSLESLICGRSPQLGFSSRD